MARQEPVNDVVDRAEPRFERQVGRRADDASVDDLNATRARREQRVARGDEAGVDPEDPEARQPR